MMLPILVLVLAGAGFAIYRHLARAPDTRSLWRSAFGIGSSIGIGRAVLACAGWYGVEHTGGPLQIPAFVLTVFAWPEAVVLGRHQGAAPLRLYVILGLLLVVSSLLVVGGMALMVRMCRKPEKGASP